MIGCNDECGAKAEDTAAALSAGWESLQITGRWRCLACYQALYQINNLPAAGTESNQLIPAQPATKDETQS